MLYIHVLRLGATRFVHDGGYRSLIVHTQLVRQFDWLTQLFHHVVGDTTNMKADILTKIMPAPNFVRLRTMVGVNAPRYHEGKIRGGVLDGSV